MKKSFECDFAIFNAAPTGHVEALDVAAPALADMADGIHTFLGKIRSSKTWPYRNEGQLCVACDITGHEHDIAITIMITGRTVLPAINDIRSGTLEGETVDAVDAFYLIEVLLQHLRLPHWSLPNHPLAAPIQSRCDQDLAPSTR